MPRKKSTPANKETRTTEVKPAEQVRSSVSPAPTRKVEPPRPRAAAPVTRTIGPAFNNYEVPKGEENVVHVEIEQRSFNPVTLKRESAPQIYKTDPRQWQQWLEVRETLGWSINQILHLPEGAKEVEPDPFG